MTISSERKNDFAVAPHASNIMPPSPNETKSISPHTVNIVPPEQQIQENGNGD
mgnify:FL=1